MSASPADEASPPPGAGNPPHLGKIIIITFAAALGGLLFGFDTSVINGAVNSIQSTFNLGSAAVGITVAITLIGCAIGAWFAGQLADVWGRKPVMVLAASLFVISSIGSAYAFTVWELMSWRLIGGLAIGIASVIAPAYIGEMAPARIRGVVARVNVAITWTGARARRVGVRGLLIWTTPPGEAMSVLEIHGVGATS